jgi:hypothetical protein
LMQLLQSTQPDKRHVRIIPGRSSTIDVIFTHAFVPAGTFNLERTGAGINTKILLNMRDDDCYQRGVFGLADTIEGVAAWLRAAGQDFDGDYLRMIGFSTGGTAAVIFGDLLDADTVIAIGPELQLGVPGYRSHDLNPVRYYHRQFRDVRPLLHKLGKRLSMVFPAWDITDFRHIHNALQADSARVFIVPDMHSGSHQLDWKRITAAPGPVDLGELTLNGLYDWRLDLDYVALGAAGFEAIGHADDFATSMFSSLLAQDPDNPGIRYRAAAQYAMMGDFTQAAYLWPEAAALIGTTGFPLKGRYREYEPLVTAAAFQRLEAFVHTADKIAPFKIAPRKKAETLAVW